LNKENQEDLLIKLGVIEARLKDTLGTIKELKKRVKKEPLTK